MPVPQGAKIINRSTLSEEVHDTLLGWILDGELRPGEKILDSELAERLGVSRTPVREALRRLEDKGLIETAANRWTRVSPVSIGEVERTYPIIWTLEALATELAFPRLGRSEQFLMVEANRELETALAAKEPVRASRADARFHQIIIDTSDNPELIGILAHLKIKLRRLEVLHFEVSLVASESVHEHAELLAALGGGRGLEVVQRLIRSNWQSSLSRLRYAMTAKAESPSVGPELSDWISIQRSNEIEVAE
jgi:DNA-binding GntR family transcriptional regulator